MDVCSMTTNMAILAQPAVLDAVRYYLSLYGCDYHRATWSFQPRVSSNGLDCASIYGDSARIANLSALTSALGNGLFGLGSNLDTNYAPGLPCRKQDGTSSTAGMVALQYYYAQPTVVDLHAGDQTSSDLRGIFSGVKSFLDSFAPTDPPGWRGYNPELYGALFILGETLWTQVDSQGYLCGYNPTYTIQKTYDIVNDFNASSLAAHPGGTVFRPWQNFVLGNDAFFSCLAKLSTINPPYQPTP